MAVRIRAAYPNPNASQPPHSRDHRRHSVRQRRWPAPESTGSQSPSINGTAPALTCRPASATALERAPATWPSIPVGRTPSWSSRSPISARAGIEPLQRVLDQCTQDGSGQRRRRQGRLVGIYVPPVEAQAIPEPTTFWSGPVWPVEWRGATAARGGRPLDARSLALINNINASLRKTGVVP